MVLKTYLHVSLFTDNLFRILGGSKQLKLPCWGSETCLMDYVPRVHQLLDEKVQSLVQSYVQRKEFTASFLSVFAVVSTSLHGCRKFLIGLPEVRLIKFSTLPQHIASSSGSSKFFNAIRYMQKNLHACGCPRV